MHLHRFVEAMSRFAARFVFTAAACGAIPLAWSQSGQPYWQLVKSTSGYIRYVGNGCNVDTVLSETANSMLVGVSDKCGGGASTSFLFEWTSPPATVAVSVPLDVVLKTTIKANAITTETYQSGLGAYWDDRETYEVKTYAPFVGPAGKVHSAGEVFIWDNLKQPRYNEHGSDQIWSPPATWAERYAEVHLNYVNYHVSGAHWQSHTYKLVVPKPKVSSTVSGARFGTGIAPGGWVTIKGDMLSESTRIWGSSDFVGGRLPTSLDGVQVLLDGKSAFVYYVSPSQVNVLAPDDIGLGSVRVEVKNSFGTSDASTAVSARYSPAVFTFDPDGGKHVLAHTPDGAFLAKAGIFTNATTRPARLDEVFVMYATGLGPTNPPLPSDRVPDAAAPTVDRVAVRIGGVGAEVLYSGKIGPGLYQLNVRVPATAPVGEQPLVVEAGSVASPPGSVITLQR